MPEGDNQEVPVRENKKSKFSRRILCMVSFPVKNDKRRVRHSIKVGVALVLVSLLYLLDPLYEQVGDNAMWAIMTVVVVFEFYAGFSFSLV